MNAMNLAPRFKTPLGNDGFTDPPSTLKPFAVTYLFKGHIFGLCIWAHNWSYAEKYAKKHNLKLEGIITNRYED